MGQRILRREDSRFLLGNGLYVENMDLPGALHATFVRSPYAHARIVDVDASAALELPGTQVFTASDVGLGSFQPPPFPGLDQGMGRPFLARDVVRFVGDIVAVVVTEGARKASTPRSSSSSTTTRCRSSSTPSRLSPVIRCSSPTRAPTSA